MPTSTSQVVPSPSTTQQLAARVFRPTAMSTLTRRMPPPSSTLRQMVRAVQPKRPPAARPQRLQNLIKSMSASPQVEAAVALAVAWAATMPGKRFISTKVTVPLCNSSPAPSPNPAATAPSPSTTTTSRRLVTAQQPTISRPMTTPPEDGAAVLPIPSVRPPSRLPSTVRTSTTPSPTATRRAALRALIRFLTSPHPMVALAT